MDFINMKDLIKKNIIDFSELVKDLTGFKNLSGLIIKLEKLCFQK